MANGNKRSYLEHTWRLLQVTYALLFLAAGLDKFFNFVTLWHMYVSPLVARLLPVTIPAFMGTVGVLEIAIGILLCTRWVKVGAYAAAVWMLAIALNLVTIGIFYDIAVRDIVIAMGAVALARLSVLTNNGK